MTSVDQRHRTGRTPQRIGSGTAGGDGGRHTRDARDNRDARFADGCACGYRDCAAAFARMTATPDPAQRLRQRNRLVERHLTVAQAIAGRYRYVSVPVDDLSQVASLALVQAADRFDPGRGVPFSAFAALSISGSLKHHFRETLWPLQTPRRLKELYLELRCTAEEMSQRLGRSPTVAELAAELGRDEEEILDALQAAESRQPLSIDGPTTDGADETASLAATLGTTDRGLSLVDDMQSVHALLGTLPARECQAVLLRFFGNMTQSQIADRIGCSQMHVSRLLRSALAKLRKGLQDAATA